MTIVELEEGLKNGSITLDLKGHCVNPVLDIIKNTVEDLIDSIKEFKSGKAIDPSTKKLYSKEDVEMFIKYYTVDLERDYQPGQRVKEGEHYCFDCGTTLSILIVDEKTVTLVDRYFYSEESRKNKEGYKNFRLDLSLVTDCEIKKFRDTGKLVSEINVPTGDLIFTNYFKKEELYTMPNEYKSENSINCIQGRYNLMQHLAAKNIGYGQMGNMSVSVFVKNTGDEIIIGSEYDYDGDDENYVEHEGFKNIGDISLSVWRWMCGDLQVLKDNNEELPTNLIVNKKIEDDYKDYIWTKVTPGTWVIEHFHDFSKRNDIIYSKLYLKK